MTAVVPRLCAGCGVPLSRYNRQSVCSACARFPRGIDDLGALPKPAKSPGTLVRTARRRRGWSQSIVADRAGLSVAYLSQIENGRRPLASLRTVRRLARALEVSPTQLVPWLDTDSGLAGNVCPWCGARVETINYAIRIVRIRDGKVAGQWAQLDLWGAYRQLTVPCGST